MTEKQAEGVVYYGRGHGPAGPLGAYAKGSISPSKAEFKPMTTMRERLIKAFREELLRQAYPGGSIRDMHIDPEAGTVQMRSGTFQLEALVDALLAELRAPTEEMVDTLSQAVYEELGSPSDWCPAEGGIAKAVTAMIDAIGAEKP